MEAMKLFSMKRAKSNFRLRIIAQEGKFEKHMMFYHQQSILITHAITVVTIQSPYYEARVSFCMLPRKLFHVRTTEKQSCFI